MSVDLKRKVQHKVATVHSLFEELPLDQNGNSVKHWNRIKCWAAKNAYTLIFLSLMFVVTWTIQVLIRVTE